MGSSRKERSAARAAAAETAAAAAAALSFRPISTASSTASRMRTYSQGSQRTSASRSPSPIAVEQHRWTPMMTLWLRDALQKFSTSEYNKIARHVRLNCNLRPEKYTPKDCQSHLEFIVRSKLAKDATSGGRRRSRSPSPLAGVHALSGGNNRSNGISATGRRSFSLRHTPPNAKSKRRVVAPNSAPARQRSSGRGALANLQQPRAMYARSGRNRSARRMSVSSAPTPSPRVLQQASSKGRIHTTPSLAGLTRSSRKRKRTPSPPTSVGSVPVGRRSPKISVQKILARRKSDEGFQEYEYLVVPTNSGGQSSWMHQRELDPSDIARFKRDQSSSPVQDVSSSSLFHGAEDADDFVDSGASVDVGEASPSPVPEKPRESKISERAALRWCISEVRRKLRGDYMPDGAAVLGLEKQSEDLGRVLDAALRNGENRSIILVGPRGCGKSFVLRHTLRELRSRFVPAEGASSTPFLYVRLNGLLQTDDATALKEITRQLSVKDAADELEQKEYVPSQKRAAAAASSSSNSSSRKPKPSKGKAPRGNFAQHLQLLEDVLWEGSQAADGAPVVFVLDEFEAFARSNKQTLLYNLLDLCQSSDTHMVVVGMTCRLDCIQLLEKRIQSRFDNRQLLFSHPDYNTLMKILSQRLLLGAPAGTVSSDADSAVLDEMVTEWNKSCQKLFSDANLQARRILEPLHMLGYSVGWFLKALQVAACRLLRTQRRVKWLQVSDLREATIALTKDVRTSVVKSLSTHEVIVVVAMAHLEQKDVTTYSFETVYKELLRVFATPTLSHLKFSKIVGIKVFEHLLDLKLVSHALGEGASTSDLPKEFRRAKLLVDPDTVMAMMRKGDEIACPTAVRHWALHPLRHAEQNA